MFRSQTMRKVELLVPEQDIVILRRGGILHDIGKIAIQDVILQKEGPLTQEEFELNSGITKVKMVFPETFTSPSTGKRMFPSEFTR